MNITTKKTRVVVGLSGGVDSSVAALLLLEKGYDVHGVFMKNWEETEDDGFCTVAEDLADAESIAKTLNIPLHVVNFANEYKERVFSYFLQELTAGRTPNPDVLCNTEIKFNAFLDYAVSLGAEKLATGHYSRVEHTSDGKVLLKKAIDNNKDQTYFLHGLSQKQLHPALFPIGGIPKPEVRELAEKNNLVTFDKKDSTGICFIGERDFRDFIRKHLPTQPGNMVNKNGDKIGEHMGLAYYTIGQRHGLGIGGSKDSSGEPWFVSQKILQSNTLVVVQGTNNPNLFAPRLVTEPLHWINDTPLDGVNKKMRLTAKTRYRQQDQDCKVTLHSNGSAQVDFDQPQRAITPGQYLVLYDNDICLGGGIIAAAQQPE
jgi:tRNA-specific 2-thiouridylase